jgi:hypothetical protein
MGPLVEDPCARWLVVVNQALHENEQHTGCEHSDNEQPYLARRLVASSS